MCKLSPGLSEGPNNPVQTIANSFTDYLDAQTVFLRHMLLGYRARRSHTRMEGMGYKSLPHI